MEKNYLWFIDGLMIIVFLGRKKIIFLKILALVKYLRLKRSIREKKRISVSHTPRELSQRPHE